MAKGSSSRSGPAPDPKALRRDRDSGDWVDLPAAGREGPAPDWPLSKATKREVELWEREWARPQAIMWERNHQELEVALYVRNVRLAEMPSAPNAARTLVVRQMEELGISQGGLRRNNWRIVDGSAATAKPKRRAAAGARDRLQLIQGG